MRQTNERRRYSGTSSLTGWANPQKDPCNFLEWEHAYGLLQMSLPIAQDRTAHHMMPLVQEVVLCIKCNNNSIDNDSIYQRISRKYSCKSKCVVFACHGYSDSCSWISSRKYSGLTKTIIKHFTILAFNVIFRWQDVTKYWMHLSPSFCDENRSSCFLWAMKYILGHFTIFFNVIQIWWNLILLSSKLG